MGELSPRDQLDLGAVGAIFARRIDEANLHALRGKIEPCVDLGRAHDVAIISDRFFDRRRRNADVIEPSQFHCAASFGSTATGKFTELAI